MNTKLYQTVGSTALVAVIICLAMSTPAFAKVRYIASLVNGPVEVVSTVVDKIKEACALPPVEKPIYSAELVSTAAPEQVAGNQLFEVIIQYRNTGNQPWFGSDTICQGQSMTYLGTTRQLDRESLIHAPAIFGETKWISGSRIKMNNTRVNPGETAEFSFIGHAPEQVGIYREYFAPVTEGKAWMNNSSDATFDLKVGNPIEAESVLEFSRQIFQSVNLLDPSFYGAKKIHVDLSEQKMTLSVGDMTIRSFLVSTGTRRTPTPIGDYKIQFKQFVRVAASSPHYIMPRFMQFRRGGYGIHALPSLANDRGVFWREALNHIGTPRSHGCIRLLPDDAEFAYKFVEVGTEMKVVW